ncbi:hypothetical protein A3D05_04435 [Candidatus Gottesmanbacteria bacterium RIFCSPHIGHO2_02_FULL_40_24]|uniref:Uncharacterized protein n=1 Tax=Candidatus Gottesmanbacteria bacterium RIFCSPHIGHO2_01_FULL_40_15 TaxID=1798376 RepID=A0A1F5Z1Q7_9BACT|nr:MAG: hypothetical protein A2777_05465 [Candidatus Gottesmanbacteria bacterium RIFCSPHIGHO2_01_FULL_40_15]OGG16118.1 MAG: hypothetical protein A3D05_04435 [Candidatus Gottesmanbacteria bacterium RIFCSPHIGHO2_02_FULL_40_24]OGG20871.1 MAG: hypothetical protein A3B48_06700 [Candidatus Gottesmanbacteria bacterium RIFCSPLOWO2_01_FULL_40_10]OGG25788.1 MAG: hypothetical protein A3E42_05705 [Candidatus Gottesmanbacteria bacterium RIFCSPHIGHO2_12_FULL_40_13]OGG32343.1 MAG: hypothetical protein A3I80_0
MKKDKHIFFHYLSLFFLLSAGFILFYQNQGISKNQLTIAFFISFFYVIWGIIHHYLKGDLHWRIVIEYSLIAILAVILIRGAILR